MVVLAQVPAVEPPFETETLDAQPKAIVIPSQSDHGVRKSSLAVFRQSAAVPAVVEV